MLHACLRIALLDRSRLAQRDDSATAAKRLSIRRRKRHKVLPLPSHTQNKWARSGTPGAASARWRICILAGKTVRYSCPSCSPCILSARIVADHFESASDLIPQHRKIRLQGRLFRVHDYVHRRLNFRPMQANRLPQPPFDAVALHRAAENPADGKTYAQTRAFLPRQIKHCHVRRKVAPSRLVHPLEVAVPEQARAPWECLALSRRAGTVTHSSPKLKLRNPTGPEEGNSTRGSQV